MLYSFYPLIHPNTHLLSIYYVPGTLLGTAVSRDTKPCTRGAYDCVGAGRKRAETHTGKTSSGELTVHAVVGCRASSPPASLRGVAAWCQRAPGGASRSLCPAASGLPLKPGEALHAHRGIANGRQVSRAPGSVCPWVANLRCAYTVPQRPPYPAHQPTWASLPSCLTPAAWASTHAWQPPCWSQTLFSRKSTLRHKTAHIREKIN